MKTFTQWLEAMFNMDLSKLEGEPFMVPEWGNYNHNGKQLAKLKVTYHWKGYQILPHQAGYSKPDEFGSIELEQDLSNPDYFDVVGVGVAKPFQRRGYATKLYQKALELLKSKGFKGIRSDKAGRTQDASRLWQSFNKSGDDNFDYLS